MSDFIIQAGTDSGITWPVFNKNGTTVDFTGWSAVAQIRTINNNRLLHTFSTADNTIVLNYVGVTLIWDHTQTATWKWKQAKYSIELTSPDGKIGRLVQGVVTLSDEVTV